MCAEYIENLTPERRRRGSILARNSCGTSSSEPDPNERLARNIAAEEKEKWNEYEKELKAEYTRLKSGVDSTEIFSKAGKHYTDYLKEDEKNFLADLKDIKSQCEKFMEDANSVKEVYKLLVPELINHRKRLQQMIDRKKNMCSKAQMDLIEQSKFDSNK